jgi:hypothetical protein
MTINRLNQDVTYLPAFRNLVINGAMQVAQRGTSTTGITGITYDTADRWRSTIVNQGTWTQTVENDAPTGSGFRKSVKMLCTTADATPAAGDFLRLDQRIEGQNLQSIRKGTSSAQQLTASFWVKSNVTGNYVAELFDTDNTRQVSAAYTIASSGTWEKKTIVFPADTTGTFDNDNAVSLAIIWWLGGGTDYTSGTLNTSWASSTNANRAVGQTNLAAATDNYWQITGVQLEVGAVATPFEFKPFDQDLKECQRYYYRLFPAATDKPLGFGGIFNTTNARGVINFPVEMRVAPTAVETSGTANHYSITNSGVANVTCNAVPSFSAASTRMGIVNASVASGLTDKNPAVINTDPTNGASAYIGWSGAEL